MLERKGFRTPFSRRFTVAASEAKSAVDHTCTSFSFSKATMKDQLCVLIGENVGACLRGPGAQRAPEAGTN